MATRALPATRPTSYSVSFKTLLTLPVRLCSPPPVVPHLSGRFKFVPDYNVHLEDVLNMKHIPPLSLKDFEEYLCIVEFSPENLYYELWFRGYTTLYKEWENTSNNALELGSLSRLAMSFNRARATFFSQISAFELNIPSDIKGILQELRVCPPPAGLGPVNAHVNRMLQESFRRFLSWSLRNSGSTYLLWATIGGACLILLSIIPFVMSWCVQHSRWIRLWCWLPLLFGTAAITASFSGICPLIFALGYLRQLRSFELAMIVPSDENSQSQTRMSAANRSPSVSSFPSDLEAQIIVSPAYLPDDSLAPPPVSPISPDLPFQTLPLTAGFIPPYSGGENQPFVPPFGPQSSTPNHTPLWSSHSPISFDFDALPRVVLPKPHQQHQTIPSIRNSIELDSLASRHSLSSISSQFNSAPSLPPLPVFPPLTVVLSPVIQRAHWEVVVRTMLLSITVATVVTGGLLGIPEDP